MQRAEVDRPVVLGILGNVWSLITGPVTLLLIAIRFEPIVQGYYFTFSSVLALRVFAELGLGAVIVQFASHEWSKLALDSEGRIGGDMMALSRLVSLGRIVFVWYLTAGAIVAVGLGLGGYLFFSQSAYPGVDWVAPWLVLCLLSGINLWLVPVWSLLEGCNQLSRVYVFRLFLGIFNNVAIWISLLLGANLWTAAVAAAVGLVWSGVFLFWQCRHFFAPFFSRVSGARISWRAEIWPMQWRIALSWLSGYFISWLFTPVMFHYHGAAVAGQTGMTLSVLYMVASTSNLWTATKAPQFGMLIAKKAYAELDRLFFRVTTASYIVLFAGSVAVWLAVYLANALHHPLATRLLPTLPTGVFVLANMTMQAAGAFSTYLRAHKREPFLGSSVASAILIGICTWLLGKQFGAMGAGIGFLAVSALFSLPYSIVVWSRCRASWHADAAECLATR